MMNHTGRLMAAAVLALGFALQGEARKTSAPQPLSFGQISLNNQSDLLWRVGKNLQRLEEKKYWPQNVFLTEEQSGDWPGDTEGRTILALTLDAQASGHSPKYLDEIIRRVQPHLNEKGYMGTVHPGIAHEQQLSGNGWMLRGLCEYYLWKRDEGVRKVISSIARNLFLPLTDKFAVYPIAPEDRVQGQGAESGNIVASRDGWALSTDVGCVFIGMEGLIHAYAVLGDPDLQKPIETLIGRFLQVDLTGIKAQTHATLTACRGLLRYAELTGNRHLVQEAEARFRLYVENGMTENCENYNWFDRFGTWTEPCAIMDSYMLAVQLWQQTLKPEYLEWAELIYYNAICHTQRHNGGFGCDNCPGKAAGTMRLAVSAPEAHWCCTMRGGEGLSSAVHYTCFSAGKEVWLPFYQWGKYAVPVAQGVLDLEVEGNYPYGHPFANRVEVRVNSNSAGEVTLRLAAPSWMQDVRLSLNGKEVQARVEHGFVSLRRTFAHGDRLTLDFNLPVRVVKPLNAANTDARWRRVFAGPLMLGYDGKEDVSLPEHPEWERGGETEWFVKGTGIKLTPVCHPCDPKVWEGTGYSKQILF